MAISLSQAKKILGKHAAEYTDVQLEEILSCMYGVGEVLVELVREHGSNQNTVGIDEKRKEVDDNGRTKNKDYERNHLRTGVHKRTD